MRQFGERSEQQGLSDLVGQLASDAREVASAEISLIKARTTGTIARYKTAAIFFVAAGVLALAAFIALLVGLILSLLPFVGPGFATLIVVGAVLVVALILALIGRARLAGPAA